MRISTRSMYETATSQLGTLQAGQARIQQQLSTGRRNLTPADDPIASARALELTQSQSINTQFATNRKSAQSSLSLVDNALGSVTLLIQDVQELAVSAGNGTFTDSDRAAKATEMEGRLQDMLSLANTSDGNGSYLFSGFKTGTPPFVQTAGGAAYQGDQGQRQLQVGSARQLDISDSGSSVFENNVTGNGTFTTAAKLGNGGSGVISQGSVTSAPGGHRYELSFSVAGTASTYTVTDLTLVPPAALPSQTAVAFQPGQQIAFDGMQFDVKGSPANGDTFTVEPSKKESLFATLSKLIGVLRTPASGAAGQAALTNGLNTAHINLDSALENVLSVRAGVGSSRKELDYLDSAGEDLNLQYATTLRDLQDLDMVKAISMFTQQQTALEAAQKTFTMISGLSLFNYIS